MIDFPEEIRQLIFTFLDFKNIKNAELVCKQWLGSAKKVYTLRVEHLEQMLGKLLRGPQSVYELCIPYWLADYPVFEIQQPFHRQVLSNFLTQPANIPASTKHVLYARYLCVVDFVNNALSKDPIANKMVGTVATNMLQKIMQGTLGLALQAVQNQETGRQIDELAKLLQVSPQATSVSATEDLLKIIGVPPLAIGSGLYRICATFFTALEKNLWRLKVEGSLKSAPIPAIRAMLEGMQQWLQIYRSHTSSNYAAFFRSSDVLYPIVLKNLLGIDLESNSSEEHPVTQALEKLKILLEKIEALLKEHA